MSLHSEGKIKKTRSKLSREAHNQESNKNKLKERIQRTLASSYDNLKGIDDRIKELDDEKECLLLKRQELIQRQKLKPVVKMRDLEDLVVNQKLAKSSKSPNSTKAHKLLERSDLDAMLRPGTFLNNFVLDCALNYMCATSVGKARYLALPTYLYTNVQKGISTKHQVGRVDIFSSHVVTFANVNSNHWVTIHYNPMENILWVYDPLHSNDTIYEVGENMKRWVEAEAETKNHHIDAVMVRPRYWKRQEDGTSCGLFCLEFASSLVGNLQTDERLDPMSTRRKYFNMLHRFTYEDITSSSEDDEGLLVELDVSEGEEQA